MPTSVGPNTFGEGNLVFGYDTGDTANSYRGEPTENLATLDLGNTSVWYNEDAATTTKELQSETLFGYPVYKFASRPGSIWITPFAFNGYDKANGPITVSAYIRNMGAVATVSTYLSGDYSTDSLGSPNYKTIPTDGVWRRYSWTRTSADMNTANQLEFRTSGDNMQISCPQVEHKLHPTPIVDGTRSATQGLIDLTGNSTIDLTNVSFDSNAQMTFDGTDDGINLGTSNLFNQFTDEFTIDTWVRRVNAGGTWGNIIGDYYTNSTANSLEWQIMMSTSGQLTVYNVTGGYIISPVASGFGTNTWVNVVLSRVGSTLSLYANSNLIASTTNTTTFGSATGNVNIGVDGNSSSEPFAGDISALKIYSRGLSAEEIKANYNAIKGRFNI